MKPIVRSKFSIFVGMNCDYLGIGSCSFRVCLVQTGALWMSLEGTVRKKRDFIMAVSWVHFTGLGVYSLWSFLRRPSTVIRSAITVCFFKMFILIHFLCLNEFRLKF